MSRIFNTWFRISKILNTQCIGTVLYKGTHAITLYTKHMILKENKQETKSFRTLGVIPGVLKLLLLQVGRMN